MLRCASTSSLRRTCKCASLFSFYAPCIFGFSRLVQPAARLALTEPSFQWLFTESSIFFFIRLRRCFGLGRIGLLRFRSLILPGGATLFIVGHVPPRPFEMKRTVGNDLGYFSPALRASAQGGIGKFLHHFYHLATFVASILINRHLLNLPVKKIEPYPRDSLKITYII